MVVVSLLLSALIISGTALAEGQKISIKNFKWSGSGGGTCPEKEGKIFFDVTGKICEIEVENENLVEEVTVEREELKLSSGCNFGMGGLCLSTKVPEKTPECEEGKTKLAAGKGCFNALEYFKKPAHKEEMIYKVETKSTGNLAAAAELHVLVE